MTLECKCVCGSFNLNVYVMNYMSLEMKEKAFEEFIYQIFIDLKWDITMLIHVQEQLLSDVLDGLKGALWLYVEIKVFENTLHDYWKNKYSYDICFVNL